MLALTTLLCEGVLRRWVANVSAWSRLLGAIEGLLDGGREEGIPRVHVVADIDLIRRIAY